MADVFISYVEQERALTQSLARHLERAGLTVWWDSALLPSDDFQKRSTVSWTPAARRSSYGPRDR